MPGSDGGRDSPATTLPHAGSRAGNPAGNHAGGRTGNRTEELSYRLGWLASGTHPGSHRSRITGAGDQYFGNAPLVQGRDARRLDLRSSAIDPLSRTWVREFRQRSRVPVMLLVDLSRSMDFIGHTDRRQLTARFARALGRAAFRRGDPFGLIGAGSRLRRDLIVPPTVTRHAGERIGQALEAFDLDDGGGLAHDGDAAGGVERRRRIPVDERVSAEGLLDAVRWLPQQRALVFVVSDGHLSPTFVERLLRVLVRHEVVLVLLHDSAERQPPARWGLARLADLESGRERLVFLRPGLAERMAAQRAERLALLGRIARRHQASLLEVEDELDLVAVARHFIGRPAS